jgi:glycine/D-amino acid oxidase-like deaminating enzyme
MHVAVLGAGIMGCSAALSPRTAGRRVTLLDAAPQPCAGASRWNEGKIHLGYLYAADPSLATRACVLDGGVAFKPLIERLIGHIGRRRDLTVDDVYLVHRRSVVDADAVAATTPPCPRSCASTRRGGLPVSGDAGVRPPAVGVRAPRAL